MGPALFLSLKISLAATLINLPIALILASTVSRRNFRGKWLLEGTIQLPIVMPPTTTGYLLLYFLGRRGLLGGILFRNFGFSIAFTSTAAVIASMVVAFPLIYKSIRISFDMADRRLEQAAATLGAAGPELFFRVTLPQILPGLLNGAVLGFARSLGEFGATMVFAGNIEGETRTLSLAVYSLLQVPGAGREAAALVIISILISFTAIFISQFFGLREFRNKRSVSP
jgi:molybdate transport system permease protein